jgi:tetratricopeptide (TPR) repeat protein
MRALATVRTVLLLAAAFPAAARADTFKDLQSSCIRAMMENRTGPRGVADLYRAESLGHAVDGDREFEAGLRALLSSADSAPEVTAHAASVLAGMLRARGDFAGAEALDASLAYVRSWSLLGPFEDESKSGFDAAYPPETDLQVDVTYMGKVHPITWRTLPVPAPGGVVPLDHVLDPGEKVAGYALSFVRVSADTPCVIRGGYNEAHKVWVDGELVGSRRTYSGRAFDQYAYACTLRRGWNVLLVKLCNQESGWNFTLRLTNGEGRPLAGWEAEGDPRKVKEKREAILAKNGAPPPGFAFRDPEAILRDSADSGGPEAQGAYGYFLHRLRWHDRSDPRHLEYLKKAAEGRPTDALAWLALADAEEDHNARRAALEKGVEANPEHPVLLAGLAEHSLDRNMPFPALELLRRARTADPKSPSIEAAECRVLLQFASNGAAAARLRRLLKDHPDCPDVRVASLAALRGLGPQSEADAVSDRLLLCRQDDPGAWASEAAKAVDRGRVDEGRRLFERAIALHPLDRDLPAAYASKLLALDRPAEARQALERLLTWCPDWSRAQDLLGDVLETLGDREGALSAYRQALILMPQDEALKRKVAFLSPRQEEFWAPYRVAPEDLPRDLGPFADQPAAVLLDSEVVKVQSTGLSSRYVQRVVRILDAASAERFQSVSVTFDPDREEVQILEASIQKADGTRVHSEVMVTDALSDPQVRLYYRNRNLVMTFPSIQPGDRLWVEYRISDVGQGNEFGQYFGDLVPFGESLPVLSKQYTLLLPAGFPLYLHQERLDVAPMIVAGREEKVYRWNAADLPPVEREPGSPGFTETAAYLHVSTFEDRDAMGAWYARFTQDQWEPDAEVRARAAELVAGLDSNEAKVRAIHRWVVQQTRYVGLEFGVHGYLPYKVRQVFARRFGDCKDKALLMAVMLRLAGLDAAMVLVRTRDNGEIAPAPASLAIFNHAICYVPELDLFLDGTAEYSAMHELPDMDQGVLVQIVWPDGRTRSARTPVAGPDANTYLAAYRLEVVPASPDATGSVEVTIRGQECAWIRSRYGDPGTLQEVLEQDLSGTFPGSRLTSAESGDLRALASPVEIRMAGRFGQAARPDGEGTVSLPLWMGRLDLSSRLATLERRSLPLQLDHGWRQTYDVTYALPTGSEVSLPPPVHLETPFGKIERSVSRSDGEVRVVTAVTVAVERVEPREYAAFRDFCLQVDRVTPERLRVLPKGGAP